MKARIKSTNIIIDVEKSMKPNSTNPIDVIYVDRRGKVYNPDQLEIMSMEYVGPDWNMVRINASIAAMHGLINALPSYSEKWIAENAVAQADALIECLKNKMD